MTYVVAIIRILNGIQTTKTVASRYRLAMLRTQRTLAYTIR
jgi:hypothetical protein